MQLPPTRYSFPGDDDLPGAGLDQKQHAADHSLSAIHRRGARRKPRHRGRALMTATFIDCPPFLHELYRGELAEIVPDLAINVGSPAPDEAIRLLEGSTFAMNDHTTMDAALLEACPGLRSIVFLGTGGIGKAMVRLGAGVGMRVLAWNRSGVPDDLPAQATELDDLLAQAHVVSIHLTLNEGTRGLIGRRRLGLLKPGAIF